MTDKNDNVKNSIEIMPGTMAEVTIEAMNHQGEGVGRLNGLAVFVPRTIPGESAQIRITDVRKNYARGEIVQILCPSPNRISHKCSAFGLCGGSQYQHMEYKKQLEIKRQLVADSLKRIGKIDSIAVEPVLGMSNPWAYRNKAQYQVKQVGDKVRLGFYEEGTHELVPAAECLLMNPEIRETAHVVEELMKEFKIRAYDKKTGEGLVRHVIIRRGYHTGEIMVAFVTANREASELEQLAHALANASPAMVSIVQNLNSSNGKYVFGRETWVLYGKQVITDKILGISFHISAQSFFQVNPIQTEILYGKALEMANLKGDETVLDVYCGIGTLSLLLATKAGKVYGFESVADAVADARVNAQNNGIQNVEFISGKAEDTLPDLVKKGLGPDVVVVDPPRQGVERNALEAIARMEPQRIVYVSCDPATMARDVGWLVKERGYRLEVVQPVDMFPQTAHTETVCLLKRA